MVRFFTSALFLCMAIGSAAHAAGVMTDGVTASVNVSDATNAVGLPVSSNFGTDISPFTPAFTSYVVLGDTTSTTTNTAAASLTLHFAQPVIPGAGPEIGVFTNTGIVAGFDPLSEIITGSSGPALFSSIALKAIVSVSNDDVTYVPLNGGAPVDLSMVANAFTDSMLSYDTDFFYVDAVGGTTPTDPFLPFNGLLSDFAGKTYPQMLASLGSSFGGKWIDVSSAGLAAVNYIRFDVPQGADYRLVLDAVTAVSAAPVPEPATLGLAGMGVMFCALRRRRSV